MYSLSDAYLEQIYLASDFLKADLSFIALVFIMTTIFLLGFTFIIGFLGINQSSFKNN